MAEPFIGQIELFSFGYAPKGWAVCDGRLMSIQQNQALFSLFGTTYGGNGVSTFALPDLRGAAAMGQGTGNGLAPRVLGEVLGTEAETLIATQNAPHTHGVSAVQNPNLATNVYTPDNTVLLAATVGYNKIGAQIPFNIYAPDAAPNQPLAAAAVGPTGGQPHANMMPYLAGNYCMALVGIYPSRN